MPLSTTATQPAGFSLRNASLEYWLDKCKAIRDALVSCDLDRSRSQLHRLHAAMLTIGRRAGFRVP